jgi:hypothetical protein
MKSGAGGIAGLVPAIGEFLRNGAKNVEAAGNEPGHDAAEVSGASARPGADPPAFSVTAATAP